MKISLAFLAGVLGGVLVLLAFSPGQVSRAASSLTTDALYIQSPYTGAIHTRLLAGTSEFGDEATFGCYRGVFWSPSQPIDQCDRARTMGGSTYIVGIQSDLSGEEWLKPTLVVRDHANGPGLGILVEKGENCGERTNYCPWMATLSQDGVYWAYPYWNTPHPNVFDVRVNRALVVSPIGRLETRAGTNGCCAWTSSLTWGANGTLGFYGMEPQPRPRSIADALSYDTTRKFNQLLGELRRVGLLSP